MATTLLSTFSRAPRARAAGRQVYLRHPRTLALALALALALNLTLPLPLPYPVCDSDGYVALLDLRGATRLKPRVREG
eukprot:scaffold25659_cov59-Phaeocystis_antarctica.AAC.4